MAEEVEFSKFMEELVTAIKEKMNAQSARISKLGDDLSMLKSNDLKEINARLQKLEAKMAELEKLVAERTKELKVDEKLVELLRKL